MRVIALLLLLGLPPVALRGEEPTGFQTLSSDGRFVIAAPRPETAQDLAVWATRGLEEIERLTGLRVPFAPNARIAIHVSPTFNHVTLATHADGYQEIGVPSDLQSPIELARVFVRACMERVFRSMNPAAPPEVPTPLLRGLAPFLVQGGVRRLYTLSFAPEIWPQLPPPHLAWSLPEGIEADIACLWALRWLLRDGGPVQQDPQGFWRLLASTPTPSEATWRLWFGENTLRDVHLRWDLWRASQERTLMTEQSIDLLSERRMNELLRFRPAEFGIDGVLPRHQPASLTDLVPHIDEAWVPPFLQQWMVRMNTLGFRQSEYRRRLIEQHVSHAGLLLEAARKGGRTREKALEAFRASAP